MIIVLKVSVGLLEDVKCFGVMLVLVFCNLPEKLRVPFGSLKATAELK
jgi:hypothetical protein